MSIEWKKQCAFVHSSVGKRNKKERTSAMGKSDKDTKKQPFYESTNVFSSWSLWWVGDLVAHGFRHPLQARRPFSSI